MRQQIVRQIVPLGPDLIDRARQINRIPKDDGGHHQVEAGGSVSLIFKGAVA